MKFFFLNAILTLSLATSAAIKDPIYDDFEGLDLVEALLRDGRLDLAESELKAVQDSDRKTKLIGDLAYSRQRYSDALSAYRKLPTSATHHLLKARAAGRLNLTAECVSHFRDSQDLWLATEADVQMKSSCEFQGQLYEQSLSTLRLGFIRHKSYGLLREKVARLLELGLSNAAFAMAIESTTKHSPTQLLGLTELFQAKKLTKEALSLLELGRLPFPYDVDVNLSLAKVYFSLGHLRATAECFERAARTDKKFAYHSAEIRRQLGDRQTSAFWMPQIPDEKEKIRARLAHHVDTSNYPLVASLDGIVSASPISDDDEVHYALGYSLFRQGQTERPLKYLNRIRSSHYAEKGALLKKSILEIRDRSVSTQ